MADSPYQTSNDKHLENPPLTEMSVAPHATIEFTNGPDARSQELTMATGLQTFGLLNQRPSQPSWYTIGVSQDVGERVKMEDTYSFVVDYAGIRGQALFAVFDGHSGKHAAEWCGQHFHEYLLAELTATPDAPIPDIFTKVFSTIDSELGRMTDQGLTRSGSTALAFFIRLEDANGRGMPLPRVASPALLRPQPNACPKPTSPLMSHALWGKFKNMNPGSAKNKEAELPKGPAAVEAPLSYKRVLHVANVGDTRGVLSRSGEAIRLSYDHKASDKEEIKRITGTGGFVINNRVNGILAISRSLGDSSMKEFIIGTPYTFKIDVTDKDEFLIMGSDGLWDVLEDQPAVDLIKDCQTAQDASAVLLKHAMDNQSADNVTVLVVKLQL